jgi:hypothetical protein
MSVPTENGRYYQHPTSHAMVPSVTNVLHTENKDQINRSNVRKAVEYMIENRDRLSGLTPDEQKRLGTGVQFQPHPASRIGDIVHAWVDGYIKNGKPPWELDPIQVGKGENVETIEYHSAPLTARRMWRQFEGWRDEYNPTFINAEFTVWSYKYGYAGTADWAAHVRGYYVLADTKTGAGVWPEVGKQVAALINADVMVTPTGQEYPLPKFDRGACLHLRPTYARFHPLDNLESAFQAFLGLKANFDHNVSYSDKVVMRAPKIETNYQGV